MGVHVVVEQRIARPRGEVARFAMDPANDTRWITALSSARTLTEGPFGRGSRVERVASFLGRRVEYINEVVAYEPPQRLEMRSVKAPFPMRVVYTFEEAAGGTLARIEAAGDASGFYALTAPLMNAAVRRGIAKDLAELRRVLEGGA